MSDFKVTRYKIRTETCGKSPERPFSAVFLSDLHNMTYGENNSKLLTEIRNANPAVIFLAGDILTAGSGAEPQMDAAAALMDELTRKYPVYYSNGNHESRLKYGSDSAQEKYKRYMDQIRSFGVHVLENTCKQIEICRLPIMLYGLELPLEYYKRGVIRTLKKETVDELMGAPQEECFNILLAHNPVYFDTYAAWGADLTLSGHLHGGIVRLPLLGGVISPQMRLFPKYDRGLYSQGMSRMIVNAGAGSHTIKLRINNPPEMIVIDFV